MAENMDEKQQVLKHGKEMGLKCLKEATAKLSA